MVRAQCPWSLKKSLSGHGEKLRGIRGAIGIEEGGNSGIIGRAQRRKFGSHHSAPGRLLFARGESRRTIGGTVLVVELMSKLMQDKVLAVGRIGRAGFGRIPGEHH